MHCRVAPDCCAPHNHSANIYVCLPCEKLACTNIIEVLRYFRVLWLQRNSNHMVGLTNDLPSKMLAYIGLAVCMSPSMVYSDLALRPGQVAPAQAAQTKTGIILKGVVGTEKRLLSVGTMVAMIQGRSINLEFEQVDKTRVLKVTADGNLTLESTVVSSQAKIGGEVLPDESASKDVDTITTDELGNLVSFLSTDTDQEALRRSVRLFAATQPILTPKAIKVGDTWSKMTKRDILPGARDANVDMTALAFESKLGVPCLKLAVKFAETSGDVPLQSDGVVWIEVSSGDKVFAEWNIRNLPLGDDTDVVSGRVVETRQSGGLIPVKEGAAATATPKPNDVVAATPPKPDVKKIDDVVKDFEKLPGLMTLYRKKDASGRESLFLEIQEEQLNTWLLMQATASTGTSGYVELGEPIGDLAFQFQKLPDDRIAIVVPNWSHVASENASIERNVRSVYPDAIIQAFRVEGKQPDRKTLLIDVSDLFKGDLLGASAPFMPPPIPGLLGPAGGAMGMDRDKTFLMSLKCFPENIVAITQYHFARSQARSVVGQSLIDSRSASYRVMFNISKLPVNNGYKPRLSDPRIGYFTNEAYGTPSIMDFSNENREDLNVRFIHRYDIRKKNPTAAVSEPVEPLVFWLDSNIPMEWRSSIRDGVLQWNKAFVGIGLQNVIQVKQMPDVISADAKDTPIDTADARFNIVRWIVADALEEAHAVAHARFNPLTGQMLSGSINITSSFVRVTQLEKDWVVQPAQIFAQIADGVSFSDALGASKEALQCRIAQNGRFNAWLGTQAMDVNRAPLSTKEYVKQFLVEVTAHEMGHLLGLRHNFAASSQYKLSQLQDATFVNIKGTAASVMDYTPFNIMALDRPGVPFFSPTIGPYDYWAIQYGYMDIAGAKRAVDELPVLSQVTHKSGLPGLRFQTDELADGFDPSVTRFDLGDDSLGYWHKSLDLSERLLASLPSRMPKYGRSYSEFTRSFGMLLNQISMATAQVSRFVGAQTVNRSYKGDIKAPPPLRPVSSATQRRAIGLLHDYLFGAMALPVPLTALDKLQSKVDTFPAISGEYQIADMLTNLQKTGLRRLYSGQVLGRVVNNAYKEAARSAKALDLATYSELVGMPLWSEVFYGKSPTSARRQLQRLHVELLTDFVLRGGGPDDMKMVAGAQLRELRQKLLKIPLRGLDRMSQYHVADTVQRIERTLDAKITVSSGGGGGLPAGLMQMLMGGKVLP